MKEKKKKEKRCEEKADLNLPLGAAYSTVGGSSKVLLRGDSKKEE